MPVANNLLTSVILTPFITVLSALSLATLQRGLEWISSIAKTPQKGFLRQIKPYMKSLDVIIERIFGGNKFTVNTTNILLMTVAVLLFCLLLENNEKPKNFKIVEKKKVAGDAKSE
eukprot:gene8734-11800_t